MSRRIGNIAVIYTEEPDECAFCGRFEELRPYGPNRERICFECAQKDLATTERVMKEILFGEKTPS
jgi:hypothetical protein